MVVGGANALLEGKALGLKTVCAALGRTLQCNARIKVEDDCAGGNQPTAAQTVAGIDQFLAEPSSPMLIPIGGTGASSAICGNGYLCL